MVVVILVMVLVVSIGMIVVLTVDEYKSKKRIAAARLQWIELCRGIDNR